MHASAVILAVTNLLSAATALQNGAHDSKMAARLAASGASNKIFDTRAAALFARSDKDRAQRGEAHCADADGGGPAKTPTAVARNVAVRATARPFAVRAEPLVPRAEPLQLLRMGDKGAAGVDRDTTVGNVNGCSALFFFGAGWVVAGHLGAGGDEYGDAKETAQIAQEKGATEKCLLFQSDDEARDLAKNGIAEVMQINVRDQEYGFNYDDLDCFSFDVKMATQTVDLWKNGQQVGSVTK